MNNNLLKPSRLITFGCSLTYGHGLPDCSVDKLYPGPVHSNLAWPTLVSEKMNRECVNLSSPGSSNDRILNTILDFENFFTPSDHVVILWSFVHRALLFRSGGTRLDIMPYGPGVNKSAGPEEWELYYRTHDEYDLCVRSIKNIHHATCYFTSKKITVSNFYVDGRLYPMVLSPDTNTKNMLVDMKYISHRLMKIDKALDDLHPGVKSHKMMAELIYHYIHKNKSLPLALRAV